MSAVLSPCGESVCLCTGDGRTGPQSFHILLFVSLLSVLRLFSLSESKNKHPRNACLEIFCPLKKTFEDKIAGEELLREASGVRTFVRERLVSLG